MVISQNPDPCLLIVCINCLVVECISTCSSTNVITHLICVENGWQVKIFKGKFLRPVKLFIGPTAIKKPDYRTSVETL